MAKGARLSGDERIRELERQVLAGDVAALERLKAEWLRRAEQIAYDERHRRECVYARRLADAVEDMKREFVFGPQRPRGRSLLPSFLEELARRDAAFFAGLPVPPLPPSP